MNRTRAFLDLEEGRGAVRVLDDAAIEVVLRETRRIAVVGASSNAARPSFTVFRYLINQGLDCVPVNPNERSILG
ncbi:MAG: CoA-binding protein, partial [Dehalococcoidia bacterium]